MPANFQPNLTPPVTTTDMALAYQEKLEKLEPNVQFLMTLYLSPQLTVDEVAKAKAAGIVGAYIQSLSLINRSQIIPKVYCCYYKANRTGESQQTLILEWYPMNNIIRSSKPWKNMT
jgi:hypothetical protein